MRLTLRTLLAWMDGVLPPDAAGQMAEKVAGSAVAQTLASRIRDIVTRPTVAAAPAEGRGLAADPNSAAEFLDNVLPADRLTEFERVCIESDMQLAEVADCHRLLADLTAGRAAFGQVDVSLAERLRSIVASEPVTAADAPAAEAAFADTVFVSPAFGGPSPPSPARVATRPAVRAWLLAGLAAAILVGLVGVLGWSLIRGGRREVAVQPPPAVEPPAVEPPVVDPRGEEPRGEDPRGEEPPAAAAAARPTPAAATTVAVAAPPAAAAVGTPPAAVEEPADPPAGLPPHGVNAARVPQGEALAIAANPVAAVVAVPQSAPEQAPAPPAGAGTVAGVVAGPFVLLVSTAVPPQPLVWLARRATAAISLPAELVSPPFSQPELVIGRLRIRFAPNTRAAVLAEADGRVRLDVLFGRAVVVADDPTAELGITAAGLVGRVREGFDAPVGVEVILDRGPGSDPVTAVRRARLVSAGGMTWEQTTEAGGPAEKPLRGFDPEGRIPAGTLVEWSSATADAVVATRVASVPDWLARGFDVDVEAADRQAATGLAARLPAAEPAAAALRRLAQDPRGEQRVLAAATLALLGDYDEAVRQLAAEDRGRELYAGQWAKLESLTVPLALARGANAATRLAKAFAEHAPAGTADSLVRLARGFSPTDLAAGADAWLVEALDDPHLVVRRYAFQRLTELVNPTAVDRIRYRPDGRPEQRRAGVEWWRRRQQEGRLDGSSPTPP